MPTSPTRLSVLLTATATSLLMIPGVAAAASPDVVIAEVYGGGGNSGAPYLNDFVELYNRGAGSVSVAGWSIQYASAAGTNWLPTALNGSIAPGARYLIKLGSGGSNGVALPTPQATGTTNMSATSGKVALVTSTTALGCGSNCDTAAGVRDFIGYGTSANDFEGARAPGASNTTSVARANPTTDTDNNGVDFVAGAPTPLVGGGGGGCGYTGTLIRQVQGAAHLSPLSGTSVSNVRGVVTATRSTGFYFQDPCPDSDPATSEALFVYTATAPTVSVGQEVQVGGTVTEYRSGGASSANLTITEITSPSVTVLGTQPVPVATVLGSGGRALPTSVIDNDASGSVETSGTFDATTDGIDFFESLEAMRVQVNNPVAVSPSTSFNEIAVLADDGAAASVRTARGGIVLRQTDGNPERIILDDAVTAGSVPSGVDVGDHFSAAAVGVIDYSFGNFKLELTSAISRVSGGLTKESTAVTPAGQLSVATYNVENLDPADTTFAGHAATIVDNLKSPGIVVLEEIQDNDGPANTSVVAADQTFTELIDAIVAAGGPTYSYKQINPVDDQDGGEPGGNIRVGFLYRTDLGVSFASGTAGGSTTAISVSASGIPGDLVALSHNPGRINPTSSAFNSSRKPLVGKFFFNGQPVYVIGNHWNSKGGDHPLFGRYQPPVQSSTTQRGQQADQVAAFVNSVFAIDPSAKVVVAGDLNDFEYSTAVGKLTATGLVDLPATLSDSERYGYVYEGNSQVLDHLLLSPALSTYSYDVVHANAEFAAQLSDHDPSVVRLTI
ncbi:putative large secreted protein [Alloactinosynnema sp. L-07]|uniref:lamin tail domain-containing protein n=1 Tax=Alloactinosynnema sp. L-07 TaxID=1653480 RepID=UPI00065F00A6|nr:lamin tail domain-containing protein [Alloactinosynnema sp. L-07]CRK56318.1 putative large secreted protein [Alloactinosynnema sp. L-07]